MVRLFSPRLFAASRGFVARARAARTSLSESLREILRVSLPAAIHGARELCSAALENLFPRSCVACRAEHSGSSFLCIECAPTLVPIGARGCARCGGEVAAIRRGSRRPSRCARCRDRRFAFRAGVAGLRYRAAVRDLILAIKFHERPEGVAPLVPPLCQAIRDRGFDARVDLVVAVPLHPFRRFRRGFDQADLLARAVARRIRRPYLAHALRRRLLRGPQSLAPRGKRFENVANAFAPGLSASKLRGRRVLLIDDVLTSGATADAAARALLRAGARAVYVAVAAT